jgi:hypothetical protein
VVTLRRLVAPEQAVTLPRSAITAASRCWNTASIRGRRPGLPPPIMIMSGFSSRALPRSSIRPTMPESLANFSPKADNFKHLPFDLLRREGYKIG